MTPDADYFQGYLASFVDALRPAAESLPADAVDCACLSEPAGVARLLDQFAVAHNYRDRRATASLWSKYFFSRLGIGTLVAQLADDCALELRLDRLQMVTHEDGTPDFFVLGEQHGAQTSVPGHDLSSLVDDAFTPVIAALSRHCRLSTRVFWSNAGVYIAWALGELESQQRVPADRLAAIRALLSARTRPDGGFNPFDRIYKDCPPGTLDGDSEPADHCRRLCCMRDLDPQWGLCANCPRAMQPGTPDHATG